MKIARLGHRRVGDCPCERRYREIDGDQDDAVGESQPSKAERRRQVRDAAYPAGTRPDEHQHHHGERADDDAGRSGSGCAQFGAKGLCGPVWEELLGKLSKPLAGSRVARLDDKGVQCPEAAFDETQERSSAKRTDRQQQHKQGYRPESAIRVREASRNPADPGRCDEWRYPEQEARSQQHQDPSGYELGQADLRNQRPRKRKQRAAFRARRIILDVTAARIEERLHCPMPYLPDASPKHLQDVTFAGLRTPSKTKLVGLTQVGMTMMQSAASSRRPRSLANRRWLIIPSGDNAWRLTSRLKACSR